MSIPLGVYFILNVAHCNIASLWSNDDKDPLKCRLPGAITGTEQWEISPLHFNLPNRKRYTIKNVHHGHFASFENGPMLGDAVFGTRTENWWVITHIDMEGESSVKDAYSIKCFNRQSGFSWTLMEEADNTPIELHPFNDRDRRSLWRIIPHPQLEAVSEMPRSIPFHDQSILQLSSIWDIEQETGAGAAGVIFEWMPLPQHITIEFVEPVTLKMGEQAIAGIQMSLYKTNFVCLSGLMQLRVGRVTLPELQNLFKGSSGETFSLEITGFKYYTDESAPDSPERKHTYHLLWRKDIVFCDYLRNN
ncbi:uncharacterized protein LAESUDRAFT_764112 [Laetiporus sulphureus 93-53]|uniref:Ricin B lectin domain-containing protein n=1 Tax=Laetiporus sulphureus 93-53 TaxID=1314785 RepID=A0A165BG30_9APHY|nr:uncharacterized protein LAESUDRAFT_764112 [Laetiporus sulphureus 93-53]KZT00983.1 hypothetical protein LAESUDRAFT_764112 [Laetiporus sulphureus 93-53]